MSGPQPRTHGNTISRLVVIGALIAVLLVALRFAPVWARRAGLALPTSLTSLTGSFQPFQPVEDALAGLLARGLSDPPPPGVGVTPQIRYESPWPQWLFLVLACGGAALIIWLYRREDSAPRWAKILLASLRILLLLLAMLLLSEVVLTLDRTGLPTFLILIDDSSSSQVVDAYSTPAEETEAKQLAQIAQRPRADRLALGLGWLLRDDARLIRTLANQQKVRLYRVSDAAIQLAEIGRPDEVDAALGTLSTLQPTGTHSRLGDGIRQVLGELHGSPPTAILLLSDGQNTDGTPLAEAAELARKEGVPIFTVGLGDETPPRDLLLSDLQVDEVVFAGDTVRFAARFQARGFPPDNGSVRGQANLRLLRGRPDSTSGELELVESRTVPIPPEGQPQRVEIEHKPTEPGSTTYRLEIEPQPRELQTENNRLERVVEVRDQKLRVLIVEGEPRWEFRYLKTYLERDNTIDLHVMLQSADDRYAEQDRSAISGFPPGDDSPESLFLYDVVVLGDVDTSLLNNQQMNDLASFVTEKGGGLMLVAGELFNPLSFKGKPLELLLPIRLDEARNPTAAGIPVDVFRPQLTPEGRASAIFRLGDDDASSLEIWNRIPPSYWYFEAPRKQPTAVVLAEHPTQTGPEGRLPLLVTQFVGSGKVLFSAIDDTWRWRLRTGDKYFGRYWVQTLRYLARSKRLGQKQAEISTDRLRYLRGQTVQVQVRFTNPSIAAGLKSIALKIEREGQPPRTLELRPVPGADPPAAFETTLTNLTEGNYKLTYLPPPVLPGDPPASTFQVDPPAGEFARLELNAEALSNAAQLTQGHFFRWNQTEKLVAPAPNGSSESVDPPAATPTSKSFLELLPPPQKVPLDSDPPIPLWSSWPLFLLFLSLVVTEWVIRKRMRMT